MTLRDAGSGSGPDDDDWKVVVRHLDSGARYILIPDMRVIVIDPREVARRIREEELPRLLAVGY